MNLCLYVCVCICMFVFMYVFLYVYMYASPQTLFWVVVINFNGKEMRTVKYSCGIRKSWRDNAGCQARRCVYDGRHLKLTAPSRLLFTRASRLPPSAPFISATPFSTSPILFLQRLDYFGGIYRGSPLWSRKRLHSFLHDKDSRRNTPSPSS